jgi:hypothetical protein
VTSPRDHIDDWLEHDVSPLSPPPGSLDRIRRRARQRKTRQATFAAAGCAVILAAAVTVPQIVSGARQSGQHRPISLGNSPVATQPAGTESPTPDATGSRLHEVDRTRLSTTTSGVPVPANFEPTSVTFVGNGTGGVVGAVIGQAGIPGHCRTSDCTSLAGTSTYGQSWYGVSAPIAPEPDGGVGVSQLRFANLSDGWAYGPAMWETTGGGWPWQQESTDGYRVIDVEAVPASQVNGVTEPARAFAVFGACSGTGSDYAAHCSSYSLWTSVAGSLSWTPVSVPAGYDQMASASSAAPILVISANATGYLLTPSGAVLTGPTTGGAWRLAGQAPCTPSASAQTASTETSSAQAGDAGSAGSDGSGGTGGSGDAGSSGDTGSVSASPPVTGSGAEFAAGPQLLLSCQSSAAAAQVTLYTSAAGASWQQVGSLTVSGTPTSLASSASDRVVLATTTGIEYSADGGRKWQAATFASAGSGTTGTDRSGPPGGFSYVGMTSGTLGVAVPADSGLGAIYVTHDGGKIWRPSTVAGG